MAEVIREVLNLKPDIQIVILTLHTEEWYLREVFKAGARAFVLKKSSAESLKEVGRILNISKRTAETHRENIMIKLGLQNRAALVRYALEQGWMPQVP